MENWENGKIEEWREGKKKNGKMPALLLTIVCALVRCRKMEAPISSG